MRVLGVALKNFRNFDDKVVHFSKDVTVLVGDNGTGKTNILESINLLATGKSFKAKVEREMIKHDAELARVQGKVVDSQDEEIRLEVMLTRGFVNTKSSNPDKAPKKRLLVNRVAKRLVDFAGNLKTVFFGPGDLSLVTSSPSSRRRFLNNVLFQVDREYRRSILSYEKGLRQRNKLLFKIRESGGARSQLHFWDKLLIKNGDYIAKKREEVIDFINSQKSINGENFEIVYDKSAISESRLEKFERQEVAAATTLVGPHRDDFIFKLNGRELASFGSRGEARMGILWIKIAEVEFVRERAGEYPTLLLDDIFSELDHEHREVVMEVAARQQTIITTADPHFVIRQKGSEVIEL